MIALRLVLLPIAALVLVAASAVPAAAQEMRTCTDAELVDAANPLIVETGPRNHDFEPKFLIPGRAYRALIIREYAIAADREPVDGSFEVTGPAGLELTPGRDEGRSAWAFTAPRNGPVTLTARWQMADFADASDVCQTSATLSLPVRQLRPVVVGRARLDPDGAIMPDVFVLPYRAPRLAAATPVSVRLWARRGTTRPPAPTARPTMASTLRPDEDGGFDGGRPKSRWSAALGLNLEISPSGVRVSPHSDIPVGSTTRFAVRAEVRQGGRRLGGFRAGAVCRRVQLPFRSTFRCRAVALRQL